MHASVEMVSLPSSLSAYRYPSKNLVKHRGFLLFSVSLARFYLRMNDARDALSLKAR